MGGNFFMLILGIDTSSKTSAVGLLKDDLPLGNYTLTGSVYHSESLNEMIDDILKKQNLKISDIDLFAVGIGPGSWTGLRIGLAVIKTFAQTLNKPMVTVSSLGAYAENFKGFEKIVPVIDAKRNRIYYGIYSNKEKLKVIKEDCLENIEDAEKFFEDAYFVGESAKFIGEKLQKPYKTSQILPTDLCKLALEKYKEKGEDNFYTALPNYLNVSQAEREYGKNKKSDK